MKNRLETWQVNTGTTYGVNYENNGNIDTKTGLGAFRYNAPRPHAVTGIDNTGDLVSETEQRITYTPFNKADTITEGNYRLEITYGPDQARKITRLYNNDVLEKTKYFAGGNYEVEINGTGNERKLHYIYGGDGLAAIYEHTGIAGNLYYIHKDHLGSFTAVSDETGAVVEEMSFDAWGRRRNPADWSFSSVPANYMFDRGYTGHEHLNEFSLINMNGRVYDPLLGRFLSPDNYIQLPDYTQSLNRYSYALNNPLIYIDPTGEKWEWKWLSPFYWFDEGMQWINDNTRKLSQKMMDLNIPAFGGGVNTSQGSFHYVGNSGNIYHNPPGNNGNAVVNDAINNARAVSYNNGQSFGTGDIINQQFVGESPLANSITYSFKVDAISGPAIDAGPYVGRIWKKGMPTTFHNKQGFLVVSETSSTYLSINNKSLYREFTDYLGNKNSNISIKYHPINPAIDGTGMMFMEWLLVPSLYPIPDWNTKEKWDNKNLWRRYDYYRKAQIIKR